MTVTPEKLRKFASALVECGDLVDPEDGSVGSETLHQAADEIERLKGRPNPFDQPCYECGSTDIYGPICAKCNPTLFDPPAQRQIMTMPRDDCECRVCETLRNPPPPSERLKSLMAAHKAAGHKGPRK